MNHLHHRVILLSESSWTIIFHAYSLKWKGMKVVQWFSSQEWAQLKKTPFSFNKSLLQGLKKKKKNLQYGKSGAALPNC